MKYSTSQHQFQFNIRFFSTLAQVATMIASGFATNTAHAARPERRPVKMEHKAISGTEVWLSFRHWEPTSRLHLKLNDNAESGKVTIPRFCGRLRSVTAPDGVDGTSVSVHPEPEYWVINWKGFTEAPKNVYIDFDQPPVLLSDLKPAKATGDGSFMLHAWQAKTTGEKLRFEPQMHKNTVGYWVGRQDTATWTLKVTEPGEFNVGILQGCGKGQGGSIASMTLLKGESVTSTCDFEVQETGHFQNFQWRTVGMLKVTEPGTYHLKLAPKQIAKNALMDCRAINLVRLPAAKK